MKDALKAISFLILAGVVLYSPIASFVGLACILIGFSYLIGVVVYSILGDGQLAIVIGVIAFIIFVWALWLHMLI